MKRSNLSIVCVVTISCCLCVYGASAADVQIKRFKAGDVIYAEDVNSNFQALADVVKQLEKRIVDLETQNRALQAEIVALKKQPVSTVAKTPKYRLRSTPKTVSSNVEARQVFGLDQNMRPLQYSENNFESKGDVVIDHATGLTWQPSGSPKAMTYQKAQQYVQQLNQERFAGYADWRLPTVPELVSLITEERQTNKLYIQSVFDATQRWCWSADTPSTGSAWVGGFLSGSVYWSLFHVEGYVRCVRSGQ